MGDLTLGSKLRAAREIKGVDISTAAEKTKILGHILRELEADDFHSIAAPIYAKGFIRSYSAYLGIDPQSLLEEYMAIHPPGQDMKSAMEEKASKKGFPKIPPLNELLPIKNLKPVNVNRALLSKVGIGVLAFIIVVVLVKVISNGAGVDGAASGAQDEERDRLIAEPQDAYLIKPGVVETK